MIDIAGRLPLDPAAYAAATPFPHCVVDGLLTLAQAREARESFPAASWAGWKVHRNGNTEKRDCGNFGLLPEAARRVVEALNSDAMVRALEQLTGVPTLESDPHLEGGGMHLIGQGGFLGIHADFNIHTKTKKRRAVNLLLYLERSDGGDLELWDEIPSRCVRRVPTEPGRAVIFTAGDRTFHGHPDKLRAPSRRSIAAYYYLPEITENQPHSTIYPEVP